MTNPSKIAGTTFETACVRYARDWGFPEAERIALHGTQDHGDVRLCRGIILECKNTRAINLAAAVDQAEIEAENGGAWLGVAVIKRRQRSVPAAYAVVSYDALLDLIRRAEGITL